MIQAHRHGEMLAVWQDLWQGTDYLHLTQHSCNGKKSNSFLQNLDEAAAASHDVNQSLG